LLPSQIKMLVIALLVLLGPTSHYRLERTDTRTDTEVPVTAILHRY